MANMISAVSSMLIISFHLVLLLPSIDNAEARPLLTDAVGLRESDSLRSVVGRPTPLKSIQLSSSSVDVINGGGYNNRYQRPSRSPPPAPRSAPPKHQTPWLGEVEDGNIDDSKSNYNIIMRPAKSPPPPPYSPPGPSNIQFVSSGSFSIGLPNSLSRRCLKATS